MKRAVIYNRCSTEEEAQINALAIQAAESREIVHRKGWLLVDQYIESESGTTAYKRSEYQRLLEDIPSDKFDIIVIKSIDRLMRSAKDWYIFIDIVMQNQKQLYIYIDHKFYSPDDSLLTGIKAILAEDFSRELSKKIKNAHKRRQMKQTGFNITVPMFGWNKIERDVYVVNEEEAEAYRQAFALAKEGKGFYSIANIMYREGVRGKNGKRISDVQWRNMLYSPRAHGTVVLHTKEYDFEAKKEISLPESEWIYIENALPPIVSKEYQMQVIQLISDRKKKVTESGLIRDRNMTGLYDFSGKIYCAECGAVYYRTSFLSGNHRMIEWKCSTALKYGRRTEKNLTGCHNRNVSEGVVRTIITENCKKYYDQLFGCEDNIAEEVIAFIQDVISRENGAKEVGRLEREWKRLEKKKEVLFQKLIEEVITDEEFKQVNLKISDEMKQLREKMNNIKRQRNEYNDYEKRLLCIKEALSHGIIEQAKTKELITGIEKIVVYADGRLEILFNKVKMQSLFSIYCTDWKESELDGHAYKMVVPYEYKNNRVEKRENMNHAILELFRTNPELMLKEVPELVGGSMSYVRTSIKELKEKGMLRYERYGNTHTGRWIVNEASGMTKINGIAE